ncbi:MAG: rod shape-determining protein MreC [Myxococcales bacterium]|nr:rod shape-determining protein MreC [Myxococcales bacterium]
MNAWARYRRLTVLFLALVLPLVSLWYHSRPRPEPTLTERILMRFVNPAQSMMSSVVGTFSKVFVDYIWLVGVVEENRDLRRQNEVLAGMVQDRDQLRKENRRLKDFLRFKGERTDLESVTARVLAKDVSPFHRVLKVKISAGTTQGIERLQPVITPAGVVGHVEKVMGEYAEVKLTVDAGARVAVTIEGRDVKGSVVGSGDRNDYQAAFEVGDPNQEVKAGDMLVTSGEDERFPKGLVVGYVSDAPMRQDDIGVMFQVTPSVNFKTLEFVQIVTSHHEIAPSENGN